MLKKILTTILATLLVFQILIPVGFAGEGEAKSLDNEIRHAVTVVEGSDWGLIRVEDDQGHMTSVSSWDFAPGDAVHLAQWRAIGSTHNTLRWESTPTVEFSPADRGVTFIMPDHSVEVSALQVVQVRAWVQGGTIHSPEFGNQPTAVFEPGFETTLTANRPPAGYRFSHWSSDVSTLEVADIFAPTTSVTIPDLGTQTDFRIAAVFVSLENDENGEKFTATITGRGYFQHVINENWVWESIKIADFAPGEIVRLTHYAETSGLGGYRFSHWDVTPAVEFTGRHEFIMPASDVEINAVWVETTDLRVQNATYEILEGQMLNGIVVGSTIEITANMPAVGYHFSHWVAHFGEVSEPISLEFADQSASTTTFIIPEVHRLYITAVFVLEEDDDLPGTNDHLTAVTIDGGAIDGGAIDGVFEEGCLTTGQQTPVFEAGTNLLIVACEPQAGYRFSHWVSEWRGQPFLGDFSNRTAPETTFLVPQTSTMDPINIRAVFIPIESGYQVRTIRAEILVDGESQGSSRHFEPGDVVTLRSQPMIGFTAFGHWEVNSEIEVTHLNEEGWMAYFIMPAHDVEVRAVFIERVLIDIQGGEVIDANQLGLYPMGSTLEIAANSPQSGYRFSHWVVAPGSSVASVDFLDSTNPRTSFVVPQLSWLSSTITIIAVFETDESVQTEPPADPSEPSDDDDYTWILLPDPNPTEPETLPEGMMPVVRPTIWAIIREKLSAWRSR